MGMAVLGMSGSNFTPAQHEALMAPFSDDQIEILPSGECYTPHAFIRARLNQVFGPGNWGLMDEPPQIKSGTDKYGKPFGSVVVRWVLLVNKIPVAAAYGEAKYIESNPRHSWGKALESAKSNGVMRAAKDIGVGITQFWNRRWQYRYRLQHGVFVKVQTSTRGDESQWRHIDSPPLTGEIGIDERSPNQDRYQPPTAARRTAAVTYQPRTDRDDDAAEAAELRASSQTTPMVYGDGPINRDAQKALFAALKTHSRTEADLKAFLKRTFQIESTKAILKTQYAAVIDWIRSPDREVTASDIPWQLEREPGEDG